MCPPYGERYEKDTLNTFETFTELNIPEPFQIALADMKMIRPTPIQVAAIPAALDGADVLGTAETGSGKTAAFGIPLVTALYQDSSRQALVLAPTRELANQIFGVLRQLCRETDIRGTLIVGGESFGRQLADIRHGVDYIIATPGRLNDHLQQGTINLSHVSFLVLDEFDRMLEMGFREQIARIVNRIERNRQTLLFSATLPRDIEQLAATFVRNPVRVAIGSMAKPVDTVTQSTNHTTEPGKITLLLEELRNRKGRVLVFMRTKSRAERIARVLHKEGHPVVCMHGDRTQGQRKQALERFREGSSRIMVATDLAARGIDVKDIEHVINYDLPKNREDYIHRVGRTARQGKTGNAVNFLTPGDVDGEKVISGAPKQARYVYRSPRRRR